MATSEDPSPIYLDGTRMILAELIAGTIGYLKKQNLDPNEWAASIGGMFDGAFESMRGEGADVVMEHFVNLSVLPMGVEVLGAEGSAESAEVEVSWLPPEDVLERFGTEPADLFEGFGITAEEFAVIYEMQRPALEAIGLNYTHGPGKEGYVLTLAR